MPSEVRRTFAEQWGEMEEVNDMVEEVEREEREEREENDTREPETDEEEEESEDEDEEEDDETDQTDPTDYEELKAYLKTLTEEQRIKHRNFETLRNTANGFRPDYRMEKIYKASKELKDEEDDNDKNQKRNVNSQLDGITMAEFQKRVIVEPVSESGSEEEGEEEWEKSSLFNQMVSVAGENQD